jgi:hypothetical protein
MRRRSNLKLALYFSFLMMLFSLNVYAIPIVNTSGDGFEDFSNGSVYGYYQNSGEWLFTNPGNNLTASEIENIESGIEAKLSLPDTFELILTDKVTYTPYDNNSGTWAVIPPVSAISFYVVKAGNYYATYLVDPAEGTGSYSTYDIWKIGGPGTGGKEGLEISHFTGYNPSAPVPEPISMLLFGTGLVGVGGYVRRKFKK